ncbi:hypothetical protein [Bacillus safensis]|uniref:Uncharacterized protein n=1 Tax=Bacillus pumilus TaxID=1408 RepID=A0A9Q9PCG2_BACPU|nr:hypothetical protein [Bacillus safensis]MED4594652.1 hypothetical protein [Bacillus safensis]MED4639431.1 hypothetical protein [Bacillus safensis]VCT93331.1 hypothetical protein SBRMV_046 [Bacillus pumilus]VCT99238.1 hypothetical protein AIDNDMCJ_19155 [Bacillus safensis]
MKRVEAILKAVSKWYFVGILSVSYSLAIFLIIKKYQVIIDDYQNVLKPFAMTLLPFLILGFMLCWGIKELSVFDSLKKGFLVGLSFFVYLMSFVVVFEYFNQYFHLACVVMLIIPVYWLCLVWLIMLGRLVIELIRVFK